MEDALHRLWQVFVDVYKPCRALPAILLSIQRLEVNLLQQRRYALSWDHQTFWAAPALQIRLT